MVRRGDPATRSFEPPETPGVNLQSVSYLLSLRSSLTAIEYLHGKKDDW
jgi:hypothetical protein